MTIALNLQPEKASPEPVLAAPAEEVDAPNAAPASDAELADFTNKVEILKAALQRLDEQINEMQAKSPGDAQSISELAHARQHAGEIRNATDNAQATLTNAPTDAKGKKKIAATRVAALSGIMGALIVGAGAEGGAINEASAEATSHKSAAAAKEAAAEAKAKKPVAKLVSKCKSACAKLVGIEPKLQHAQPEHHWYNNALESAEDMAEGAKSRFGAITGSVTAFIGEIDPIGMAKKAAGVVAEDAAYVKDTVVGTVSKAAGAVVGGINGGAHYVADKVVGAASYGKSLVMGALGYGTATVKAAPAKPHAKPAKAAPTMLESAQAAAIAEVKALRNSLPSISLPSISNLVPSLPSAQGVMSYLGWSH